MSPKKEEHFDSTKKVVIWEREESKIQKESGDVIYGRSQSVCETKFSIRWGHLSSSAQVAGIGHDLHALNRKLNTAWGLLERSKSKTIKMIGR